MNKKQTDFLLEYAKKGILSSKQLLDDIQYKEVVDEFINIKKSLESNPQNNTAILKEEQSPSKMKEWFKGIGDRQRKYQENHKGDLV